jgi:hypothetical protein
MGRLTEVGSVIAGDHAVDFDGLALTCVCVHDEDRRGTPEPGAQLALSDILGRALRTVSSHHPDGLALVEPAVADVAHAIGA